MCDLPEAEPLVLGRGKRGVKGSATPLSATGLRHWQTVLSMLSGASQLTETMSPTAPHPPWDPKTTPRPLPATDDKHHHYHNLISNEKRLFLTPLQPPPHPREVKEWINAKITAKKRIESETEKRVENESLLQGPSQQGCNQPINVGPCGYHMTYSF